MNKLCPLVLIALLGGCSLAPDYQRPDLPVADSWSLSAPAAGPDLAWKEFFTDAGLQALIQTALDNNRDLRVAVLNVQVAQATYRVTESALVPHVTAGIAETEQRTPQSLSNAVPPSTSATRTYTANLSTTAFELDLWGHIRNLDAQAQELYLASQEGQTTARIALIAEVANAALTLLSDRKLQALTEDTLNSRVKSLDLIERSFKLGVGSKLDVAQARGAVESARAAAIRYGRQVQLDQNALALLVGAPLDDKLLSSLGNLDSQHFIESLPVGLPSQVLLRRPDIIQAEHQLQAANANIGVARSAFFPTLSLTGSAGFGSSGLAGLFQAGSGAWSVAPQIVAPIFDAGRNEANLDSAKANRQIAVATYEKAIQTAFREVSDGLASQGTLSEQLAAQAALVTATQDSTRLSQARYDKGIDSYLNVLDAQRSLYAAQQDLIAVQTARLSNLVGLYKALGGGRS